MNLRSFPIERQLDAMDCGPACLKMIAKYYGKYYSLQHLRDLCGNTREGVSIYGISHGAEKIGLRSLAAHCTIDDLLTKVPFPVIIHWDNSHFVILYKIKERKEGKSKFYIADPSKGKNLYYEKEFEEKWIKKNENKSSGVVLILEPQADFKQRQKDERAERGRHYENILGYFRPYKKSFIYLGIIMLLITCMQATLPFISKAIIDVGIQTKDITFINIVLFANLALIISITLSSAVRDWILQHISSRINIALISDYLIKLMKLPVSFFENKMLGDILQRANDHERIRSFVMNNSLNLLFSVFTFFVFSIVLFIYNVTIFYIFTAGSIIYITWVMLFLKLRKKLDWDYFELTAKNQSYWVETIEGIQDIKINNYEQAKRWKWEGIQARLFKVNLRMLGINNVQNLGANFIDSVKNLLITFFCAKAVIAGEITFGVMISTQFIIGLLSGPIQQFIMFMVSFQFAQISFMRLNEIQMLQDEDEDTGTNDIDLTNSKNIIVKNLSFQYTPTSHIILQNINIVIPQGKVTAIVGDSGSGKSTLLKLLLRLYKPSFGEILIGGMNINNIGLKQWRDRCGAVMQDGKIFNDTILNNIILNDEKPNNERLKNAVEAANISYEIEQLPLGYQTKMGENGRGLSGGQKQRVLIARALYKDPDILFFDEATNSLDTINEQKITSALNDIFKGKTVVVVAHRLSTIRKADQIIVMKDGKVIEIGNHNYLLELRGMYYQLVESQSEMKIISN
ncbi:peptidase domain-containing ABC transporter [Sphingobacterium sp. JUb56]|uniref:peptidase domain-containing ABC transporter n=1 Tax=Sphingobacterium sp. JUb56 TaxID=2587145 RepID=UPI00160E01B4|nr:peptidase domain-containing ABC transporter [Sphingobacterium sp. JUb56]MBB2951167.1 ATP-binding cassette subfamily B protein [Sphingobacterium sp. JUb56]